jgi:hypothetical protein
MSKNRYLFLAMLLVFLAVLLPRIFELDKFVTIDEPEWIYQGGNFYYALGQRDFAETHRRSHPGVTAMWAGAFSFLIEFPEYRGLGQGYILTSRMGAFLDSYGIKSIDLLETARVFIVLGTAITLTLAFYFGWRLFGPLPAIVGFLIIAFDPFHNALTRVLHHDGTMSNMSLLAMLALLSYFFRERRLFYLIISAMAAGVSVLAKVYGVFNFLFAGLIILVIFWQKHYSKGERSLSLFVQQYLFPGLIWLVAAFGTMVIFWPAMWVDPINTMVSLFEGATKYATAGNFVFFMGSMINGEGIWQQKYPFFYPTYFAWRTTPLVLIGLFLALIVFVKKFGIFQEKEHRQIAIHLAIFSTLFTASLYLSKFKADRYQLAIFPLLDLLAGLGWVGTIAWISERMSRIWKPLSSNILVISLILFQAIGTLQHYPYYFTYLNSLLGGVEKGVEVVSFGWGWGLDQVADYLNSKPNADKLSASALYGAGGLSFFFKGETVYPPVYIGENMTEEDYDKYQQLDYVIRYTPCQLYVCGEDILSPYPIEKEIWIKGILMARIYNVSDIPEEVVSEWLK